MTTLHLVQTLAHTASIHGSVYHQCNLTCHVLSLTCHLTPCCPAVCLHPLPLLIQHDDNEYGADIGPDGNHTGGPFTIRVSPLMRVEELRNVIRDTGGILPALQKLSYAGKHLNDAQRTLEQYGVAYWHNKFPHWPIKVRRY
eukprot:GHRR01028018.1.p1 GENE.GHRR01028018.1~~GHRR01028018.1.p1  ORF type:complete len:142 (+),score=15.29 GHRR01028018.1:308-733(+)